MSTPLDIAREYIARGWTPVPVPYRQKKPVLLNWQSLRFASEEDLRKHFNCKPSNIGVNLGDASGGLSDIDMDCQEALDLAPLILPPTMTFGRASKPASHWLYTSPGCVTKKFVQPAHDGHEAQTLVELRSTPRTNIGKNLGGSQTVFPGSTHSDSGESIEWTSGCAAAPSVVPFGELSRLAARLAVACLVKRVAPSLLPVYLSAPDAAPALSEPWLSRAREWLGQSKPVQKQAPVKRTSAFARIEEARARYAADHPLGGTQRGAPCPVPGCEGKNSFKGSDEHGTCFHSSHPTNCGTPGEGCYRFDSLDIASFESGITAREVLERDGYLTPYVAREEPPTPSDSDFPADAEPIRIPGADIGEKPSAAAPPNAAEKFAPGRSNVVRLCDAIDTAKGLFSRRFNGEEKPMPMPWPAVAKALGGGLWPGAHVVTGTTAAGKTAFAIQVSIKAALAGHPVLYIGLELDTSQIVARLASMAMGERNGKVAAHWSDIYLGKCSPSETEEAIESLRPLPIYVEEAPPGGWSSRSMRKRVDELQLQHPDIAPLVVLDFLQLVGPTDPGGRREELRERIGVAAYAGREVARKCGAVVLMISSISRAGATELGKMAADDKLGTGDPADLVGLGKESGDIEFSADSVLSLAREKREDGDTGPAAVWLALAKIRAGVPTWCPLTFNGSWLEESSDMAAQQKVEERAAARRAAKEEEKRKRLQKEHEARLGRILKALECSKEPQSIEAIHARVGGAKVGFAHLMTDLESRGLAHRVMFGRKSLGWSAGHPDSSGLTRTSPDASASVHNPDGLALCNRASPDGVDSESPQPQKQASLSPEERARLLAPSEPDEYDKHRHALVDAAKKEEH